MCKIYSFRKVVFFSLLSFVVVQLALAQGLPVSPEQPQAPSEEPQRTAVVAFVNVNVVPMDRERILSQQTVIVRADRISEIGPVDTTDIPQGALRIDGRDKYLMPGLVDMHVHQNQDYQLTLFIANGVTTIRNMWGSERQLKLREQIKKGKLIGPKIYSTGPIIDGNPPVWPGSTVVETSEQVTRVVAEHKKAGYDFIKVYHGLSLECYDAIIEAAAKHGMPVVGHVPTAVGLEHVLAAGQHSIEHLVGYGDFLQIGAWFEDSPPLQQIDETKIPHIAQNTREAGIWNCVTLVVFQKTFGMSSEEAEQERKLAYMKYVPPGQKMQWQMGRTEIRNRSGKMYNLKRMTKALHDAGARILLGSDTPNPYVVSGFSLHQELRNLVGAGLRPYEAIKAGTRDAAECLGELDEFGTISAGLRADLILTEDNPLEDVGNAAKRIGVMARGRWLPQSKLQAMLDALAIKHATEENPDGVMLRGRWVRREELEALLEPPKDRGPVLYLPFDEAGEPKDLSPKESPIESYVKPAELVAGIKARAWLFDQSTCVLLDTETFKEPFHQSTFSVWIKEPGEDGILYEEGGSRCGYAVALIKGELEFATRDGSAQTSIKADYPDDDNWHFITTVFDRGMMRLYIDGNLLKETSAGLGIIFAHYSATGIGKANDSSGSPSTSGNTTAKFTGIMDELRITRHALTTADIQAIYQDGI